MALCDVRGTGPWMEICSWGIFQPGMNHDTQTRVGVAYLFCPAGLIYSEPSHSWGLTRALQTEISPRTASLSLPVGHCQGVHSISCPKGCMSPGVPCPQACPPGSLGLLGLHWAFGAALASWFLLGFPVQGVPAGDWPGSCVV